MKPALTWLIIIGAGIAVALTEVIVFRMFQPPDEFSAILGGLWLAAPYLVTAGFALLFRKRLAPLIVLLVAFLIAAGVGVSMFNSSANQQAIANHQVETAVQPGEDPNAGPGGMRKSGAEMGAAISSVFSIALAVILPPIQIAVVVIPTLIGFGVSALMRTLPK